MTKTITGFLAAAVALAIGSGPALAAYEGFGDGLPLSAAAAQIVPEGWSVDYADGVDRSAPVSWSSAPDWKAALSSAVAKKGYSAEFGGSTVIIRKGAPAARAAEAPRRAEATRRSEPKPERTRERSAPRAAERRSEPRAERVAEARSEGGGGFRINAYRKPEAPKPAAPRAESKDGSFRPYAGGAGMATKDGGEPTRAPATAKAAFSVRAGDTLRDVLERWAPQAGWKVVWQSSFDYPIEADATFGGTFVDAGKALIEAMGEARPKITADFWTGNSVVVVSNNAADEAN